MVDDGYLSYECGFLLFMGLIARMILLKWLNHLLNEDQVE